MKKLILTFLVALFATLGVSAVAPTGEHMEFLGIPINYNINTFAQKISAKGFKYDESASSSAADGMRIYNGVYKGYDVELYVSYDVSSRMVYGVIMFIQVDDYDSGTDLAVDLAVKI